MGRIWAKKISAEKGSIIMMSNTTERKDKEDYFTVFVKKFEVFMQK